MNTKVALYLICLMPVLAVTGCRTTPAHVQWYQGPPLSTNEFALLRIQQDFWGAHVPVHEINGEPLVKGNKRVGNKTKEIELLPGKYDLTISYFVPTPNGVSQSISNEVISFTAEAGKIYHLRAAAEEMTFGQSVGLALAGGRYGWTAWIEETGTGNVVAGRRRETPLHWYEK